MPLVGRLCVAGTGLIGGSLALAARARGLAGEIVGFGRRRPTLEAALERGAVDRVTLDPRDAAADADLLVLAAPLAVCPALAERLRPHAPAHAVLSDVGSVKAGMVAALERAWGGASHVVGAHPIAGSERDTIVAARPDLFEGRRCVLTPTGATGAEALALVAALWRGVGAVVETMDAGHHDALLARVSHAPHVLAYALVDAVAGWAHGAEALAHAGSGFADTTRIAGSPAALWREIVAANAGPVREALAELRAALARFEAALAAGDEPRLEALMEAARAARRRLGTTRS